MSNVRRVYVEKKPAFAVKAKELEAEIRSYLGIGGVTGVRELIRYDIENISEETYRKALVTVFSEPPVDDIYEEHFDLKGGSAFSVEFLPGQFDQRADSAEQCVKLLNEEEDPLIRTAVTYVIEGEVSEEELAAIKKHCINPVDSRETGLEKPDTLVQSFPEPEDVQIFENMPGRSDFIDMPQAELKELYDSLNLAMTFKDFLHIQNYFAGEEKRNPSMTEIRVLDTYWSDHCRHTTFSTELKEVAFDDGYYRAPMEETYRDYLNTHKNLYEGRSDKFVCLMDIALMAMKRLKKEGKLQDQEESDEINACSIVVPIEVDGKTEEWACKFQERDAQPSDRDRAVRRCGDLPWRSDPRSAFGTYLCVSGNARDRSGRPDRLRKRHDRGQASAEEAGARGGARLQLLRQPDRTCDRLR